MNYRDATAGKVGAGVRFLKERVRVKFETKNGHLTITLDVSLHGVGKA